MTFLEHAPGTLVFNVHGYGFRLLSVKQRQKQVVLSKKQYYLHVLIDYGVIAFRGFKWLTEFFISWQF